MTVRRALARIAIATAATLAVVTVVSRCEPSAAAREIDVEVDVGLVPGVRAAQVELRRGTAVVAWAERRYDGGLTGPLHVRGPALGGDGEVRIRLDTDEGPRTIRRPLTAAGGSTVTIRVGE
jgi:hypothetical protein